MLFSIDKMFTVNIIFTTVFIVYTTADVPSDNCRQGRSNHLRKDGGLCFEIPPWEHKPAELEQHLSRLRKVWGNGTITRRQGPPLVLVNSEVSRYMDTVLAPFLDTYHRNIQNAYQQLTAKVLKRIKEEINAAVKRKNEIYKELTNLANELKVPAMCDEERRAARTLASKHVALMYSCTETARASIAKMGNYAEEMIKITRSHMQTTLDDATKNLEQNNRPSDNLKKDVSACLKELSRAAVSLGYELDLSLTNTRRHNEQSCTKLVSCATKSKQQTDTEVAELKDKLNECVYA